ncbi:iron-siderophore ABC transporter substrate-binding protein [Actinomycetospora cinnamomea]|uniref:Iron complex transport system substrate-binding protein n=1 Tax=Actinomycetospora cinnamomea TaxID=663609 RepID=A0A2U1FR94_9PSEU|nr:iron-siderophore ABC transporter substrate-binding protein [Actinomycetospora cinnamomea]PVZ14721.1 iron complex transport system substrate-binding protein [Actinomycetospora cinnamomea]
MPRPAGAVRRLVLAACAVVLLALAACGGGGAGGEGGGGAPAAGVGTVFPATVDTAFGPVTVPEAPQRIVALGWSDAETALALGVEPVGASDWLGFGGTGVGPWSRGYTNPPVILGTTQLDYEAVAALRPDLILDTRSSGERQRYDTLSRIAPTIAPPPGLTAAYGTSWRQQMTMVSTALGKPDEGARQVAALEDRFRQAQVANPQFVDRTVGVGAFFGGQWGAYVPGDQRMDLMTELGFRPSPQIQQLATQANGSFYVTLSGEQVSQLSADLTVVFPINASADPIRTDPVLSRTPAAQAGHLVVLDDQTTSDAFSSGSVPGTRAALERAVPLFAGALTP